MPGRTTLAEQTRRLLRCMTVSDESVLTGLMAGVVAEPLDHRTAALVEIAALVALEAEATSYQAAVDNAHASGVEDEEILGTVAAVATLVGAARVDAALPGLCSALEVDQGHP